MTGQTVPLPWNWDSPRPGSATAPEVPPERAKSWAHNTAPSRPYGEDYRYGRRVDIGYARISTAKQDLERQVEAVVEAGVARERIYFDKKPGATTDRPGLRAALEYARPGDVIVVHTLDRLGRTVRDTLNLIHELTDAGIGVRNLAGPIRVDSSRPEDPMAQLAVVLLALFAQMERACTVERAAHARSVAVAKGRRVGRPSVVDPDKLAYAVHLREAGHTIADIVAKTGITRTSLYRHLPPRSPEQVSVGTRMGRGLGPRSPRVPYE